MKINRDKFLNLLESVSPGLTAKEIIEQSSCFVFSRGKICTFNDEVFCSIDSPLGEFTGAVTAKPLVDLLSRLKDDELDIQAGADKTGKITEFRVLGGTDRRCVVRMEAEILLPVEAVEEPENWFPLELNFGEAIGVVHTCASSDESQFQLTCVHITSDYVEACDRYQIARYPIKIEGVGEVLVRATAIAKLVPLGMSEIAETPNWLHFRNPAGLVLSCRRFLEEYKSLDPFMGRDGALKIQLPGGLSEVIARTDIFSADNAIADAVRVDLRSGAIIVKGEGAKGWYQEKKKIAYSGDPLSFLISPKLLLEISNKSNECSIIPGRRLMVDSAKFFFCTAIMAPEELLSNEEREKK